MTAWLKEPSNFSTISDQYGSWRKQTEKLLGFGRFQRGDPPLADDVSDQLHECGEWHLKLRNVAPRARDLKNYIARSVAIIVKPVFRFCVRIFKCASVHGCGALLSDSQVPR